MIAAAGKLYVEIFPRPEAAIADPLAAHQLGQFRKQVPILHAVAAFNTAVVIVASWRDGVAALHLAFPALIILFSLWRIAVWRARDTSEVPTADAMRHLRAATLAIVVAVAIASGWTVWTFATQAYSQPTLVPISLAVGMFCVAHCLGSVPLAAIAALIVGTVPISIAMLSSHHFLPLALGITIMSGTVFQLRVVRDHYHALLQRLHLEAKVREQAHTDELTGLPNRRAILEVIDRGIARSGVRTPIALALIDLDGFKAVNDTLGHAGGDALLRAVADRLRAVRFEGETIGRLAGDEFIVLFDRVEDVEARALAIVTALSGSVAIEGRSVRASASLGFAFAPLDATTASQLLAHADQALYAAKAEGKGRARRYKPPGGVPSREDRRGALVVAA